MPANLRKWAGILITVICYYIVHEGSHLLVALILGVFQRVHFMTLGVQIVIDTAGMTNTQLGVFSIVGSVATFLAAYLLVFQRKRILGSNSKFLKAAGYYTTIGLLLIDPIYLSLLYGFFGGGDMNGILLLGISETAARLGYALLGMVNIFVLLKYVHPAYKRNFEQKEKTGLKYSQTAS